jgi:hypothetical protein
MFVALLLVGHVFGDLSWSVLLPTIIVVVAMWAAIDA